MASTSDSPIHIVDPRKNARYKLQLGPEIQQDNVPEYRYASVRCKLISPMYVKQSLDAHVLLIVNHRPFSKGTKKAVTLKEFRDRPEKCSLTVVAGTKEEGTEVNYRFNGSKSSDRQSFVLLLHPSSQECTLHPVSDQYNLNLEVAPPGSLEVTRMADYPKVESTNYADEATGEQSVSGAHAAATVTAGASPFGEMSYASSDSGDASEVDESNPFDFRRYLDDSPFSSQSSSPDPSAAQNTKSATQYLPVHGTGRSLKPMPEPRSKALSQGKITEFRSQQKHASVPEVRLDRRASTHNGGTSSLGMTESRQKSKKKGIDIHNAEASHGSFDDNNKDDDKSESGGENDEEDEMDDNEGAAGNALEIVYGDDPTSPTHLHDFPIPLVHDLNGPISLRSAANSASPSSRLHTPIRNHSSSSSSSHVSKRTTANEHIIDFPHTYHPSDDEVENVQHNDYPQGLSDDDFVEESNFRPSFDAQLPATDKSPKQPTVQPQSQEIEDEDDADLEAEMREGLEDADEDIVGTEVAPPPESESESEAE